MNDLLHELILIISGNEVNHKLHERNAFVNVSWSLENGGICEYQGLRDMLLKFPKRDTVEITINNVVDEKISVSNRNICDVQEIYTDYKKNIDVGEELDIHITIKKGMEDNTMSIYSLNSFNENLFELDIYDIICFFENNLRDRKNIVFELYDSSLFLATDTILFKPVGSNQYNRFDFDREERCINCRKNCNVFGFDGQLPLPNDFHFVIDDIMDNPYRELFRRIESLLAVIYISDSVHMERTRMTCQILGQRMNTYEVMYKGLEYNEVLYDVYSWIYTDGNIVDKVTLARNLLSLHCKQEKLENINSKTFMSIKANFALYQKENVNKYIELKNSMTLFLKDVLNQSKEIVMDIVGQIGRNITACLSFILTAFISNVLSGSSTGNIFSKDITYLSYVIMIGSFLYLIVTIVLSRYKTKEIYKGYKIIKDNNDFLIGTKEYEDIFKDETIDKIVQDAFVHKCILFFLWGLLIVLFFIFIEIVSDYSVCKLLFIKPQGN